jgi:hypothetical protein
MRGFCGGKIRFTAVRRNNPTAYSNLTVYCYPVSPRYTARVRFAAARPRRRFGGKKATFSCRPSGKRRAQAAAARPRMHAARGK